MAAIATRVPGRPSSRFGNILRFEWCKFRSVRSTFWAMAAVVAFNVVVAALLAIFLPRALSAHQQAAIDSTRVSLGGLHLSQVAIGLLGVLVITSEYSTGMIRATLAAVPQRRLMLTAKTLVFAVAGVIAGIAACLAAYIIFQALLPSGDGMQTSLSDPGVLRAVIGAGLYVAVLGLFALAIGALLRHTAAGITGVIGFVLVLSPLAQLLPGSVGKHVHAYLPSEAGQMIGRAHQQSGDLLSPWQGFGVFCLWTAVLLVLAAYLLKRRDA